MNEPAEPARDRCRAIRGDEQLRAETARRRQVEPRALAKAADLSTQHVYPAAHIDPPYYNDIRPHRALDGRTPLQAYSARLKARPRGQGKTAHFRVREDRVDATGKVSLRFHSKLYKIGLGRAHKGRPAKLLIAEQSIRVIDLEGELIRQLTLDPSRTYQPLRSR